MNIGEKRSLVYETMLLLGSRFVLNSASLIFLTSVFVCLLRSNMLLSIFTSELLILFMFLVRPCSAVTPPRGGKKEMQRALNTGVRSLSFDSDDETSDEHRTPSRAAPPRVRGLFSDDEDEGHGASSSGTSSGTSGRSSIQQRIHQLRLSDVESDPDTSLRNMDTGRSPQKFETEEEGLVYEEWDVFSCSSARTRRFWIRRTVTEVDHSLIAVLKKKKTAKRWSASSRREAGKCTVAHRHWDLGRESLAILRSTNVEQTSPPIRNRCCPS